MVVAMLISWIIAGTTVLIILQWTQTTNAQLASGLQTAIRPSHCQIQTNFISPFVSASIARSTAVSGCECRQLTENNAEVHVVNIHGVDSGSVHPRRHAFLPVTLHLNTHHTANDEYHMVLFVLNAGQPVQWTVQLQDVNNSTRFRFWLSKNSRLLKDGRTRSKLKKVELPQDTGMLMTWARHKWGIVTSVTQIQQVNVIYKTIGIDESAPEACALSPLTYNRTSATYQQAVATSGCVSNNPDSSAQNVGVYILELSGEVAPGGSAAVDVTLEGSSGTSVSRDIVLVLKSAHSVRWQITTRWLRGSLDIITSDLADTVHSSMQPVRIVSERLAPYSGDSILTWVHERYPDYTISYTSTSWASHFNVLVHPLVKSEKKLSFAVEKDGLSTLQMAIEHAKSVVCHNDRMTLALHKPVLQLHGLTANQLSLRDPSCIAHENETHFVLEAPFSHCGTQLQRHSNMVVYFNSMVVRDEDQEGSAMDVDDTHQDDEDFVHHHIRHHRDEHIPISESFSCGYLLNEHVMVAQMPTSPIQYHIDIYKDETFSLHLPRYPHRVSENEMMFVEARIDADPTYGMMIDSCWLTASKNRATHHTLIRSGCALLQQIKWYSIRHDSDSSPDARETGVERMGEDSRVQRFSFKYYKYWSHSHLTYIQCRIVVCSVSPGTHTQKCMPQEKYCILRNANPLSQVMQNSLANSKIAYGGPITLIIPTNTNDDANSSVVTTLHPVRGSVVDCDEMIHVQGLDLPTVVGIAFSSFFIGVLLTASLWYIYRTTAGRLAGRLGRQPHSNESSGESTPSSTAPITIHQVHHR